MDLEMLALNPKLRQATPWTAGKHFIINSNNNNNVSQCYKNSKYKRFRKNCKKSYNTVVDLNKYITNLLSTRLLDMQKRVLSLGLKFIPTSTMEQDSIQTAYARFRRGNRLKHFYRDQPPKEPHPFRTKDPPPASVEIEQYLNRVSEGLENLTTLQVSDNLSRAEHRALLSLSNNPDLVIKNADKGSGIVVEDRESYIGWPSPPV